MTTEELGAEVQRQMAEYDIDENIALENVADYLGIPFNVASDILWEYQTAIY